MFGLGFGDEGVGFRNLPLGTWVRLVHGAGSRVGFLP